MRWIIGYTFIKGEIFIGRKAFGTDDMRCFKDTGVAFLFRKNPISAYISIKIIGLYSNALIIEIFNCRNSRGSSSYHTYLSIHLSLSYCILIARQLLILNAFRHDVLPKTLFLVFFIIRIRPLKEIDLRISFKSQYMGTYTV